MIGKNEQRKKLVAAVKEIERLHGSTDDQLRADLGALMPGTIMSDFDREDALIAAPFGAKPLSVAIQQGNLCLWAEVDSVNSPVANEIEIAIRGTGHPLPENYERFLGTVLTHSGHLVWHVFVL